MFATIMLSLSDSPRSLSDIDLLLRQTICSHLHRSRPEKILNVFQ